MAINVRFIKRQTMTIPEIKALRTELEVALLQAFTEFQTATGLSVEKVEVAQRVLQRIGMADQTYVASVKIKLESL